MASELIVQTIQGPSSGANANKVLIPSGHTLDVSGGTLVPSAGQIVKRARQYFYTAEGTTSTSFLDATGGSISFACDYADSLVQINVVAQLQGKGLIRILAGSNVVTTSSGDFNYYTSATQVDWDNGSNRYMAMEKHFYSPSSTASIIYKVQYRAHSTSAANAFGMNQLHGSEAFKYSHIEIVEIKQ